MIIWSISGYSSLSQWLGNLSRNSVTRLIDRGDRIVLKNCQILSHTLPSPEFSATLSILCVETYSFKGPENVTSFIKSNTLKM